MTKSWKLSKSTRTSKDKSEYNTPKLSRDATVHQVSDWIKGINLGNERRETGEENTAY